MLWRQDKVTREKTAESDRAFMAESPHLPRASAHRRAKGLFSCPGRVRGAGVSRHARHHPRQWRDANCPRTIAINYPIAFACDLAPDIGEGTKPPWSPMSNRGNVATQNDSRVIVGSHTDAATQRAIPNSTLGSFTLKKPQRQNHR